ncbi:MAG: hypothetical protein ABH834_00455 [Candidatus Altiarchaeota archaeon]
MALLACMIVASCGCIEGYTWDFPTLDQGSDALTTEASTTVIKASPPADTQTLKKTSDIISDYTTSTRFSSTTLYTTTSSTSTTSTSTIFVCPPRSLTPCP